jgi:hypothetical protein
MKRVIEMDSGTMIYIPNFTKISYGIHKLFEEIRILIDSKVIS